MSEHGMGQTRHIFRKDVRYLRYEIGLLLAMEMAFAFAPALEPLMTAAAIFVIARLIHAEAIPGDRRFWMTRPYHWHSLLGAKLLFVVVFVSLPVFAARIHILTSAGFPLGSILPGVLWAQVVMFFGLLLPVAALGALTSGLVPFLFSAFVLLAVGIALQMILAPPSMLGIRKMLEAFGWIWDAGAIAGLAALALLVLYLQYRNRQTLLSRTLAIAGVALGVAAYLYVPWPVAVAVQSRLSKQPFDASTLQVILEPGARRFLPMRRQDSVQVDIPLAVKGVPAGFELRAEALTVTLQPADGAVWSSGLYQLPALLRNPSRSDWPVFNGNVLIPPSFFRERRGQRVALRGSLYCTLFGNPRTKTIPLRDTPVAAVDGLRCSMGIFNQLFCRAALRWPARIVYTQFPGSPASPLTQMLSYSPFPAGLDSDLIESRWITAPLSAREVTITTLEPLSHFRRDFEVTDFDLAFFANAAAK